MFRSLLQTIPTVSGNFTLACKLNNYIQNNDYEYTSYINDAILMPLDNSYNLTKDIKINLVNGKYEYDIRKYFKEISAYFYNDTYLKNNTIFETYSSDNLLFPDNRDKNFEFGCKRISYHKYKYQYQFYAPIYINSADDLPDEFIIEIYNKRSIVKKLHIPINKPKNIHNKLRIYLNKFVEKIENNTPVIWNFNDDKIIYKNAIDCKNGGFVTINSYNTIQSKNVYQTIINDIDNLICQNYAQNKIILSECIPLSFIFNIDDLLEENDLYYYHFNQFNISGYYIKNNYKCKYYTFSTNYHNNYQSYYKFDNLNGNLENKTFNLFDNDIIYSLKEATNYKLYYQNTFKNKYCQWKLLESNSYIINLNSVFTYNSIENKFPVFKNTLQTYPKTIFSDNTLYLPMNNYVNIFNQYDKNQYNLLLNNNYSNWFNIYNGKFGEDNDNYKIYIKENYDEILKEVHNNYVFINGIRYYISDNNIKYFNVFLYPNIVDYNKDIIVGNTVLEKHVKDDLFIEYNYLEENNQLFEPISEDKYSDFEDKDIYLPYDQQIKYIENINISELINQILQNTNNHYIGLTDIGLCDKFKEIIEDIYQIDNENLDKFYYDRYKLILQNYFKHIIGYQKIDISLSNYNETELFNIFKLNKEYIDLIYYSLPNSKDKINLYYDLNNQKIDYQFLLNNNVTLFIKKNLIEIYDTNQFYNIIFGKNGLYTIIENDLNNEINKQKQEDSSYIHGNYEDSILEFINIIKNSISPTDVSWLKNNFQVQSILNNFNLLTDNQYDYKFLQSIFINFCNNLLDLIIYITLFIDINNYCLDPNSNIDFYKYIPYYNDNNLTINYDYFEKLYHKNNYSYLYTNINLNSNTNIYDVNYLKTPIYVHITNLDTFKYYITTYDNLEFYHKEKTINIPQENYKLIPLLDYIDNSINEYIFNIIYNTLVNQINNIELLRNFYINENNINENSDKYKEIVSGELDEEITEWIQDNYIDKYNIYTIQFYKYKTKVINIIKNIQEKNSDINIEEVIQKYLISFNNQFKLDLYKLIYQIDSNDESINTLEDIQKYNLPIDLYIKINDAYLLTTDIDNYLEDINKEENIHKYIDPFIIYKELPIDIINQDEIDKDNKIILTEIIYNDFSKNKGQNFKYQQLSKNLQKINYQIQSQSYQLYTYLNPYNYLVKTTLKDYYENYNTNIIKPYNKLTNVNTIEINYITDNNFGYIVIKYNLMLSTNLFNIYNVDENDNFEIKYFNNIKVVNEFEDNNGQIIKTYNKIKGMFRNIYPYLKQDILLNFTVKLNEKSDCPAKIILPNNIKCKINTIVRKKTDNDKFTNITLSNNLIKILYLNRYFGNIDPYFAEVSQILYNVRSKIYIINDEINNNISDNDNVYIEDIDIYKYNQIPYYQNKKNTTLKFIKQQEYKHFNDNYLFNFPNVIEFTPNDVDYIYKKDLSIYVNQNKCFEYFKDFLQKKYFNCKSIKDEKLFLYIFNKYSIEYIQYKEQEKVLKNSYKLTYKLTLL